MVVPLLGVRGAIAADRTQSGPPAWDNWRAFDDDREASRDAVEYLLYSDSRWVGQISEGIGPYRLLNTIGGAARPAVGQAQSVLALRAELALDLSPRRVDPERLVRGTFHGGWIDDEIAALLSLVFGVRCRSGGMWRAFNRDGDPRGRPHTAELQPPLLARVEARPQLPQLPLEVRFGDAVEWLAGYRRLNGRDALRVARAARAYQLGLWIADDDPDLAWLRLISALETAAKGWVGRAQEGDIALLQRAWPELAALLDEVDRPERDEIADLIAPQVRVKSAVLRFVEHFAPPPPAERPEEFERLDWDQMQSHVAAIYDRRSEMLHEAIPLPRPMTTPVHHFRLKPPWPEKTYSTGWHDSNWPERAAPMPLWTFSYVVGGALREWWRSLNAATAPTAEAS